MGAALCSVIVSLVSSARLQQQPFNDLYAPYVALRQFIRSGENPYSAQVTREIQLGYYGRVLAPDESQDQQRFAYPLYLIVVLWPAAFVRYSIFKLAAYPLLVLAAAGFALAGTTLMRWPRAPSNRVAVTIFTLASVPVLKGLGLEQLSILTACLLAAGFLAISRQRLAVGGVLLAMASVKPHMALLPIVWALLWAGTEIRRRRALLLGLLATESFLFLIAELLLPGWIPQFLRVLPAYARYAGKASFLTMSLGPVLGLALTALFAAGLVMTAVRTRTAGSASAEFAGTVSYVLAFTAVCMPALFPQYNEILLLPAVGFSAGHLRQNLTRWPLALLALWSPFVSLGAALTGDRDFMIGTQICVWVGLPLLLLGFLLVKSLTGLPPVARET